MIERTHRVKSMSCVPCSSRDPAFGGGKIGVRMPETHAYPAARGLGNYFQCVFQFWSDRQHANVATRRLPEFFKEGQSRGQQIGRRMNSAPQMADERPFNVDSQGDRALLVVGPPVLA